MTTATYHNILIVLLSIFSLSLSLSKSAVNVVMTLIYIAIVIFSLRHKDYRSTIYSSRNHPLVFPLLAYILVAVFGLLYTENMADGLGITNKVASLFLAYAMTTIVIGMEQDEKGKNKLSELLLLMFIAGLLVLDVIGLLTYLGFVGDRRLMIPVYPMHVHHIWFANINALGLYAAASFFLFGTERLTPKIKWMLIGFLPLSVLAILFSTSRTAWAGIIAATIAASYIAWHKKKYYFITLAIVAVCCLISFSGIPIVRERISDAITDVIQYSSGDQETSLGWRFLMWKASFSMFLSNPLFGVGTGDYLVTMRRFIESGNYPTSLLIFNQPHNMYLFALATNGILGLSALLFIFYRIFSFALPFSDRSPDEQRLSFLAVTVAIHFLVAGMTDSLFNIFILRFDFAFLMGICIRLRRVDSKS